MDVVIASNLFTPSECKIINYCRIFLRVHSIADLTLAGGNHIDLSFLLLDPSLLSSASTLIEPLQDRPQTASALKLWQRANRLWYNTVTGGLHRPLGKWLVPGPQLRWVWPFYFDPDTQTLWSKTGEGFNVHSCTAVKKPGYPNKTNKLNNILIKCSTTTSNIYHNNS
jgi:hypothetical protein